MENKKLERHGGLNGPRMWSGVLLVIAGTLLLAYKMGAPIPRWVFTWPVLLIALGLLTGVKSKFHNPGAFIMIVVGSVFLIDQTIPDLNFHNYIVPAILIGVGLIYILRPRNDWGNMSKRKLRRMNYSEPRPQVPPEEYLPSEEHYFPKDERSFEGDDGEFIEINAVLGGVKKMILSKNFKGGEINAFMGGTEINLSKADIQQPIVLEVNNIFGGTKLVVPANWDIKNDVTTVFGGIEDKRNIDAGVPDPKKVMMLKGTCVFGGIEVSNY